MALDHLENLALSLKSLPTAALLHYWKKTFRWVLFDTLHCTDTAYSQKVINLGLMRELLNKRRTPLVNFLKNCSNDIVKTVLKTLKMEVLFPRYVAFVVCPLDFCLF